MIPSGFYVPDANADGFRSGLPGQRHHPDALGLRHGQDVRVRGGDPVVVRGRRDQDGIGQRARPGRPYEAAAASWRVANDRTPRPSQISPIPARMPPTGTTGRPRSKS